jgi:hypothetical protein
MRTQLQAAERLNSLLSEAVAEVGEAVSDIDPKSVRDARAALAIARVKSAVERLEKEVDEFTKRLR